MENKNLKTLINLSTHFIAKLALQSLIGRVLVNTCEDINKSIHIKCINPI